MLGVLAAVVVICLPSVYIDSLLMEEEPDPDKRAELKSQLGILIAIVAAAVGTRPHSLCFSQMSNLFEFDSHLHVF